MALYNRDYVQNQSAQSVQGTDYAEYAEGYAGDKAKLLSFMKHTYQLFAGSLLAATVGAYIGVTSFGTIAMPYFIGLVILEFALLFGLYAVKRKPGINMMVLFGFTFVSGLTLTPLLSSVLNMPSGAAIITQTFLLTSVIFASLSFFAMTTTKDFGSYGKPLMIALVVVVIGSIINLFLGSPILQVIIAGVGTILFSFFIIYDTQNLIKGAFETPIEAAIALYLDFLNLFVSLLQILGIFNSNDE